MVGFSVGFLEKVLIGTVGFTVVDGVPRVVLVGNEIILISSEMGVRVGPRLVVEKGGLVWWLVRGL